MLFNFEGMLFPRDLTYYILVGDQQRVESSRFINPTTGKERVEEPATVTGTINEIQLETPRAEGPDTPGRGELKPLGSTTLEEDKALKKVKKTVKMKKDLKKVGRKPKATTAKAIASLGEPRITTLPIRSREEVAQLIGMAMVRSSTTVFYERQPG